MAQYDSLTHEFRELQKVNQELRSVSATQARKLARIGEKRVQQDKRIERLQGRVAELRERVQKLRSFTQHYLESWKQNRTKLVEALGEEWVVSHLIPPYSAMPTDAESQEREDEQVGNAPSSADENQDEG